MINAFRTKSEVTIIPNIRSDIYFEVVGPFKYLCFTGHAVWDIFWNRRSYCISVGQDRRFLGSLHARCGLISFRRGFASGFVKYKKGALDSQPQVIKFTSCLPMVGGSLRVLRLLPPLKLVAMILLKVALKHQNQIKIKSFRHVSHILF